MIPFTVYLQPSTVFITFADIFENGRKDTEILLLENVLNPHHES